MSKRKRATPGKTPATPGQQPAPDESTDDAAVKDDMVHVTPDLLAGSPDIFAGKKSEAPEEPPAPEAAPEPIFAESPAEPPAAEPTDVDPASAEPIEASATLIPEPEPPAFVAEQPPPTPPPPHVAPAARWFEPRARPRAGGRRHLRLRGGDGRRRSDPVRLAAFRHHPGPHAARRRIRGGLLRRHPLT